jgi:hypothetical protein
LAEFGEETGVGGGKGVVGKLAAGDPGQTFAVDGPGFVAEPAAQEEFEADGAFGIVMEEVREEGDYRDFDAEFFAEFAFEAVFEGFAGFAFAAGEFPQAGKVGAGGAAGDKEAAIAKDESGGNFDWRGFGVAVEGGRIDGTNRRPRTEWEPPLPCPPLHKCVEGREMRSASVQRRKARTEFGVVSPWPSPRFAGRVNFSFGSTESRPTGVAGRGNGVWAARQHRPAGFGAAQGIRAERQLCPTRIFTPRGHLRPMHL